MVLKTAKPAKAGAYELTGTQLDHVVAAGDVQPGSGKVTGADSSRDDDRGDGLRHEVGHNLGIVVLETGS